ncbi:hypothetical protein Bbelb_191290 [Branchiostoma belcheri]|nr:hypothetical protein Bbelb_191290 [Branchiostoma belcheri]
MRERCDWLVVSGGETHTLPVCEFDTFGDSALCGTRRDLYKDPRQLPEKNTYTVYSLEEIADPSGMGRFVLLGGTFLDQCDIAGSPWFVQSCLLSLCAVSSGSVKVKHSPGPLSV